MSVFWLLVGIGWILCGAATFTAARDAERAAQTKISIALSLIGALLCVGGVAIAILSRMRP